MLPFHYLLITLLIGNGDPRRERARKTLRRRRMWRSEAGLVGLVVGVNCLPPAKVLPPASKIPQYSKYSNAAAFSSPCRSPHSPFFSHSPAGTMIVGAHESGCAMQCCSFSKLESRLFVD